ncbi:Methyl-CpG-binding domain protein 5 [Dionaea muscipula]
MNAAAMAEDSLLPVIENKPSALGGFADPLTTEEHKAGRFDEARNAIALYQGMNPPPPPHGGHDRVEEVTKLGEEPAMMEYGGKGDADDDVNEELSVVKEKEMVISDYEGDQGSEAGSGGVLEIKVKEMALAAVREDQRKRKRRRPKKDVTRWPAFLPFNWTIWRVPRLHGKLKGVDDVYYFTPDYNHKFRSKPEVLFYLQQQQHKARKPTKLPHSKTISPKAAEIEPDVASDPRIKLADDITRAKQGLKVMGIDYREAALHHIQDHDHESSMKQKRVEERRYNYYDGDGWEDDVDSEEQMEQNSLEEERNGDEDEEQMMKPQKIEVRNDDPSWPPWLPKDWRFIKRVRVHGRTKGVVDKFYISPEGKKFRSKKGALEFIEKQREKQQSLQIKKKAGTGCQSQK